MKTAHPFIKTIILIVGLVSAAAVAPTGASAAVGSANICYPSGDCSVGEFLFDDEYAAITGATCTIDSKYPNGTDFQAGTAMTGQVDGWYSYDFTAPSTTGYYRTTMCCTSGTDYLCIDKDFEVSDAPSGSSLTENGIAAAVWGYSSRTLSSFGSLVGSIWGSVTRTLTGGSLDDGNTIATKTDVDNAKTDVNNNIDSAETNIINNSVGGTANSSNITNINNLVNQNNSLLEALVNKPIIETSLEEEEDFDVDKKIASTKELADKMYANSKSMESSLVDLRYNWYKLSEDEVVNTVSNLLAVIGEADGNRDTIYGEASWLSDNWDWKINPGLEAQARVIRSNLLLLDTQLHNTGKAYSARAKLLNIISYVRAISTQIGEPTDSSRKSTLYGQIKSTEELAAKFDGAIADIDEFLINWGGTMDASAIGKIKGFSTDVSKLNKIPQVGNLLSVNLTSKSENKDARNKTLSVRGVASSNKKLLALRPGKTLRVMWLEEGSIIFKILITNPSTKINQDALVKYYLPPEIKEENVISAEEPIVVKYDVERDQYYADGEVPVRAGATVTLAVRVEDIWVMSTEDINGLTKKADELIKPLENTSFFAQGISLKSEIDADIVSITDLGKKVPTPERKIRNYREQQVMVAGVNDKLDKMQDLVTQAASVGSLYGFIGGSGAIAVWGLILIITTGFIFMTTYMKRLTRKKKIKAAADKNSVTAQKDTKVENITKVKRRSYAGVYSILLLFVVGSAGASSLITYRILSSGNNNAPLEIDSEVLSATDDVQVDQEKVEENTSQEIPTENTVKSQDLGRGGEEIVRIEVPKSGFVNIRKSPSDKSTVGAIFRSSRDVVKIDQEGEWVNIAYKFGTLDLEYEEGWVNVDNVYAAEKETISTSSMVGQLATIKNTSTGWLRVRQAPGGAEVGKVYPGESYVVLDTSAGWLQILLEDGTGWVSGTYTTIGY